ncbi:hypothetical protein TSUD_69780 [Trifolium subterraneum]|uniref:Reverse transcriptase domain-containing protein n=1 Tax=Trifolium subterraneum TaxID=3900 RepID=A0A2Z6NGJ8_TRISU|nr:hypothetical protein TSUD_69780 [Trifolium subterraneum]
MVRRRVKPTNEVSKGLRKGDPLSPFLFLIAAEGLTGLVKKAVENDTFHGFKINENIQFQILQFADDTVLVGEGSWENIWTIKTILRGFELVSGLKINFVKSKLYGINVNERFLEAASNFLLCRAEDIPFKFLGLPVGANPRRYKESFGNVLSWEGTLSRSTDSFWWRDILKVGGMEGEVPFSELFPNLFLKEIDPNVVVAKRLVRHRDDRSWYWQWRSILTQDEEDDLLYFQHLLLDVEVVVDRTDRWKWIPDHSGKFTVKSAYLILQNRKNVKEINPNILNSLQRMWKNDIPSKVGVFGWRLLLEKLPTREALISRGCAYYHYEERWKHFNFFGGIVTLKKGEKVKHLI